MHQRSQGCWYGAAVRGSKRDGWIYFWIRISVHGGNVIAPPSCILHCRLIDIFQRDERKYSICTSEEGSVQQRT